MPDGAALAQRWRPCREGDTRAVPRSAVDTDSWAHSPSPADMGLQQRTTMAVEGGRPEAAGTFARNHGLHGCLGTMLRRDGDHRF